MPAGAQVGQRPGDAELRQEQRFQVQPGLVAARLPNELPLLALVFHGSGDDVRGIRVAQGSAIAPFQALEQDLVRARILAPSEDDGGAQGCRIEAIERGGKELELARGKLQAAAA